MKEQPFRWLAILQIWYAANLLGAFSGNPWMAFFTVGCSVFAWRWNGRYGKHWAMVYPAMLPFALWWLLAPPGEKFLGMSLWVFHIPAWYLLYIANLQLLWLGRGGEYRFIGWNAMAAVVLSGIRPNPEFFLWASPFLILVVLGWMVELGMQGAAGPSAALRRKRTWIALLLTLVVAGSGVAAVQVLRGPFESWMWARTSARWNPELRREKGFDPVTWIGSYTEAWDNGRDQQVAVRLWGASAPERLRAATYDHYISGFWRRIATGKPLFPVGNIIEFSVFSETEDSSRQILASVHPALSMQGYVLLPPGPVQVALLADSVELSQGTLIVPANLKVQQWLLLKSDSTVARPDSAMSPLDLEIPVALTPLLDSLLREIRSTFQVADDSLLAPEQWTALVPAWFQKKFRYDLNPAPFVRGQDPLRSFSVGRAGYCEHFASLGTLLLRRAGVPARYAKGFAGPERLGEDLWVYRRATAHAWTEALVPGLGWRTVEMTPATYRPMVQPQGWLAAELERLRSRLPLLSLWFSNGSWRGTIAYMEDTLRSWVGQSVFRWAFGSVLAVLILFLWLRRMRRQAGEGDESARARAWRVRLEHAESTLRRHGYVREPWETVGEFLERIPEEDELLRKPGAEAVVTRARNELQEYQKSRFHPGT